MLQKQHLFATHNNPHIDEIVALFLLMRKGSKFGYEPRSLEFLSGTKQTKEYLSSNGIGLGIGNHDFDDHVRDGKGKELNSSSTLLVAKKLGIDKLPQYEAMVRYAHTNDTKGASISGELGNLIKDLYYQGRSNEEVIAWTFEILNRKVGLSEKITEYKKFIQSIKNSALSNAQYCKTIFELTSRKRSIQRFILCLSFTLNDVAAVKIAQTHGKKYFGVNYKTKVQIVDIEVYIPKEGDLCIGFGSGEFSKFPAEKMQKILCTGDRHDFVLCMEYLRSVNLRSGYHPYEACALLTDRIFEKKGKGDYSDFRFATEIINIFKNKQRQFIDTIKRFNQGRKTGAVCIMRRGELKIALVEKIEGRRIPQVALSQYGGSCDIVVFQNLKGQTVIQTKAKNGKRFSLYGVIGGLRISEANALPKRVRIEKNLLHEPGTVSGVEAWYYHKPIECIINGSETHPDVKQSLLNFRDISRIVLASVERAYS